MRRLRRARQKFLKEQTKKHKNLKQKALTAGAAAAIALGSGAGLHKAIAATPPDAHQLPVAQDYDADLLSDTEEAAIGSNPVDPCQYNSSEVDGAVLAEICKTAIDLLPWENEVTDPNQTYKQWWPQLGLHTCDICGATMAMGPGVVVNPKLGITVNFPFNLTLHYLEHGSFSYLGQESVPGDVEGRVDVPLLLEALEIPFAGSEHRLPVDKDSDSDLLSDTEETAIGYKPFNGDQNKNTIQDGAELANRCGTIIDNLPWREEALPGQTYKWCDFQHGLETCDICGETVNMGPAGIVNPTLGIEVDCPLIAIHYMQHGSFSYAGDVHNGRLDVPLLLRALEIRFPYEPNDHQLQLYTPDSDGDLLDDNEELQSGLNMYDADQDDNITPDGIELAKQCVKVIEELPVWDGQGQEPNEIYVIRLECDGLEQCDICGKWIHMCGGKIVNPKLGLQYPDANDPMSTEFLPDLALHYMSHGSFSLAGSEHTGRVNIPLLLQVLKMPQQCGHLGTIYLPGDSNKDCKEDFSDFADFANKWLKSTDPAEE